MVRNGGGSRHRLHRCSFLGADRSCGLQPSARMAPVANQCPQTVIFHRYRARLAEKKTPRSFRDPSTSFPYVDLGRERSPIGLITRLQIREEEESWRALRDRSAISIE